VAMCHCFSSLFHLCTVRLIDVLFLLCCFSLTLHSLFFHLEPCYLDCGIEALDQMGPLHFHRLILLFLFISVHHYTGTLIIVLFWQCCPLLPGVLSYYIFTSKSLATLIVVGTGRHWTKWDCSFFTC